MLTKQHFLPIFDKFNLRVAFENHDHLMKRSKRMKRDVIDPTGTLYVGDGCLGGCRELKSDPLINKPYLEFAKQIPHFWTVTLSNTMVDLKAIAFNGNTEDNVTITF